MPGPCDSTAGAENPEPVSVSVRTAACWLVGGGLETGVP